MLRETLFSYFMQLGLSIYLCLSFVLFPYLPKWTQSRWDAVSEVLRLYLEQIYSFKRKPLHVMVHKEARRTKLTLIVGYSWVRHGIWQSCLICKALDGRRMGWKSLEDSSNRQWIVKGFQLIMPSVGAQPGPERLTSHIVGCYNVLRFIVSSTKWIHEMRDALSWAS